MYLFPSPPVLRCVLKWKSATFTQTPKLKRQMEVKQVPNTKLTKAKSSKNISASFIMFHRLTDLFLVKRSLTSCLQITFGSTISLTMHLSAFWSKMGANKIIGPSFCVFLFVFFRNSSAWQRSHETRNCRCIKVAYIQKANTKNVFSYVSVLYSLILLFTSLHLLPLHTKI